MPNRAEQEPSRADAPSNRHHQWSKSGQKQLKSATVHLPTQCQRQHQQGPPNSTEQHPSCNMLNELQPQSTEQLPSSKKQLAKPPTSTPTLWLCASP